MWIPAKGVMKKVYKADKPDDWSGIVWPGNGTTVPKGSPICGWQGELCSSDNTHNKLIIILLTVFAVLILLLISLVVLGVRKYMYEVALKEAANLNIPWNELTHINYGHEVDRNKTDNEMGSVGVLCMLYHGEEVAVKKMNHVTVTLKDRQTQIDLKEMRDLSHENINTFIGICTDVSNVCVLMDFATRGRLLDILEKKDTKLDWNLKHSLLDDIACGMGFLSMSPIKYYGRLTSAKCVVDSRWTCKITGHGLRYVMNQSTKLCTNITKLLWTAPEILRANGLVDKHCLVKGDVYSYAIICQEVVVEDKPYADDLPNLGASVILEKLKAGINPLFRPHIPTESCSKQWKDLIESCWEEYPENRPKFSQIITSIFLINKKKNVSLVDNMVNRLATYTKQLEDTVLERANELVDEKSKVIHILSELLPPSVAADLALGRKVKPEIFESVSVFFSDIVGFTHISAQSDAMQIVNMLNAMYTMFDDIAEQFDVYKVATIGDAYMVASGVPIRNGDKHATAICNMALALLDAIQEFPIAHLNHEHLYMRIGIHSGSCVAGVAGIKMPRYLLFGDTVDIAAMMESGGEAMKIHISETTKYLVHNNNSFTMEMRGNQYVKGQQLITYWLDKNTKEDV